MGYLFKFVVTRLLILIGVISFIVLVLTNSGCGPFSPHIDTTSHVNGHVDTSGTITIKFDLSDLSGFFTEECQTTLGPDATADMINSCASKTTLDFINFINSLHKGA